MDDEDVPGGRAHLHVARPDDLATDDHIDAFVAATMGLSVDELHAGDDNEVDLSADELRRLLE